MTVRRLRDLRTRLSDALHASQGTLPHFIHVPLAHSLSEIDEFLAEPMLDEFTTPAAEALEARARTVLDLLQSWRESSSGVRSSAK